jgi:hypothetical protein
MFRQKTPTRELQDLDDLIQSVYSDLAGFTSDEEGFDKASDQLKKLLELRAKIAPQTRVSPDVLATVGANLLGILMVLGYEHAHVVTSKALQFVTKLR